MKRFRLNFIMLMISISAIVATSCEKSVDRPERSLSVAEADLTYTYLGGSHEITVDTDYDKWTAQPNVKWIKITQSDGKFTATAEPNNMESDNPGRARTATITVTAGTKRFDKITVAQGGNFLSLSTNKLEFSGLAPEDATEIPAKSVTVEFVKPWTASKALNAAGEEPAWFSFTQDGDKLNVTVTENLWPAAAREAITAGKIYVQTEDYLDSVIINQARAPRPLEYFAEIKYTGRFINVNDVEYAVADVKLTGREVDSVRVALVPSTWDEAIVEDILDGAITSVPLKADGTVQRPTSGPGPYTYVVLTFCKDKIYREYAYDEFVLTGEESPWVSLGFCEYTDDVLISLYSSDVDDIPTYDVEIFEHKDKPGLFRLKNPYGEDYPYNDPGDYDEDDVFIEIDATDRDGVFINYQSMGVDWGYGTHYIYSVAAHNMDDGATLEEVKTDGDCGTYQNKVITFPARKLIIADDDGMYVANKSGMWKVDMSALSPAPKSVLSKKNASATNKISKSRSLSQEKVPLK